MYMVSMLVGFICPFVGMIAACWLGVFLAEAVARLFGYGGTRPARPPLRQHAVVRRPAGPVAIVDLVYCGAVGSAASPEPLPEVAPDTLREMLGPPDEGCQVTFDAEGKFCIKQGEH
jgi:hypothetical protein